MRARNLRIALVIGALSAAAACDEHRGSPTAPTGVGGSPTPVTVAVPGPPVGTAPDGSFQLSGEVTAYSGARLPDARVEVVSRVGTFSVTTGSDGRFAVRAVGETAVTVQKEGFRTLENRLAVERHEWMILSLLQADAGGSTGNYVLTFTTSGSCSLPPDAMRRVYEVTLEERDQILAAWLPGPQFLVWENNVGFTGRRDGDSVTFEIRDSILPGLSLIEVIPSVGHLGFAGTATGTITGATITTTFSGTLSLDGVPACRADNHRMEFVRITTR